MDTSVLEEQPSDLSLKELLQIFWHHIKLIILVTLLFLGLAIIYALHCPPVYEARATIKIPPSGRSMQNVLQHLSLLPNSEDPMQTYLELAKSRSIANACIKKLHLNQWPQFKKLTSAQLEQLILKNISVASIHHSNILSIQSKAATPIEAAELANAWVKNFIHLNLILNQKGAESRYQFIHHQLQQIKNKLLKDEKIKKNFLNPSYSAESDGLLYRWLLEQNQAAKIAAHINESGIEVVDPASAPTYPVSPHKARIVIMGLFLGIFLSTQLAFWLDRFQDRIRTEEELRHLTKLNLLAHIPNFRHRNLKMKTSSRFSKDYLIGNPKFEFSYYRESFKILRTNLTFAQVDHPLQTISILSPSPQEGKTLINSDFALSLAETGKKVLLVDADLRNPSIAATFELPIESYGGLPLLIAGKAELLKSIIDSNFKNLWLLPNQVFPPNPAELLGSHAFQTLIHEMKQHFDIIIFDGPPLLPVTDSILLSKQLDGVILLAYYDQTRRANLKKILTQLHMIHCPLLGTILNGVEMNKNEYTYYYPYSRRTTSA